MKRITLTSLAALALLLGFRTENARADEVEIGKPAPVFSLPDPSGKTVGLGDFKGKYVVLEWTNPECPFVRKHYSSGNMQKIQQTYTDKGVVWLSIASSAPGKEGNYPAAEWNEIQSKRGAHATALLLDPDGKVGRTYGAKTTPHMFIVDPAGTLIYQGAIDDHASANPNDIPKSKNYVAMALDEAMSGKPVSTASTKSYGCSVKY